jgi:hypothetical protein
MRLAASTPVLRFALTPPGLPAPHRRWLLINAFAFAAVVNLIINGAIAWLTTLGKHGVPVWASPVAGPSLIVDACLTLLLLPLVACPIVTLSVWREHRRGALDLLTASPSMQSVVNRLPRTSVRRGVTFGAAALIVLGPPVVAALILVDPGRLPIAGYVVYKALFAVVLGAIVTPLAAVCAMTETLERRES